MDNNERSTKSDFWGPLLPGVKSFKMNDVLRRNSEYENMKQNFWWSCLSRLWDVRIHHQEFENRKFDFCSLHIFWWVRYRLVIEPNRTFDSVRLVFFLCELDFVLWPNETELSQTIEFDWVRKPNVRESVKAFYGPKLTTGAFQWVRNFMVKDFGRTSQKTLYLGWGFSSLCHHPPVYIYIYFYVTTGLPHSSCMTSVVTWRAESASQTNFTQTNRRRPEV